MMTPWLILPAFLLLGWAAGGVTIPLKCRHCEGGAEGYLCPGADSENIIKLRVLPDNVLRLDCHGRSRDANFSLLRECNVTTFRHFEFNKCPLPTLSFGEIFRMMGVSGNEVDSLAFFSGTFTSSPGLEEWHLDSLSNLKTLQLVDNRFSHVPPALLTNTPKLKFFRLTGNGMDSLPHTLLTSTPELVMADLGNNNLTTVPEDLFANLTKLTNVSLWNNSFRGLETNLFRNIPNLKFLDLRDNLITGISREMFQGMKILRKLNLGGNAIRRLSEGVFDDLANLEELELHSNFLEHLPHGSFDDLRLMKKLILRNNHISLMADDIFYRCESLEMLDLSYNRLRYVLRSQFPGPKTSLTYIDLGNNNISFSEEQLSDNDQLYSPLMLPLNGQLKLQHILLANNRITDVIRDFNWLYDDLKTVDLSGNLINAIDFVSIHFNSDAVQMNLKNNKIKTVSLDKLPLIPMTKEKNVTLSLEGNPLICNCRLYTFTKIVQESAKGLFKLYVDDADKLTCTDVDNTTHAVQSVDYKILTCQLDKCMENCSCLWRSHDEMIIVNCPFLGLNAIPELTWPYNVQNYSITLNLMNNSITNLDGLHRPFYNSLTNLSLSNNKISYLNESDLPPNLKVLDLRGNNLTALSAKTLDYLNATDMTLSLGGNPWICNCDVVDFWTFLQVPERKVLDEGAIYCEDGEELLLDINEYSVCPFFRQPMVIVTIVLITVFLLLFAVLGTMSFYKYKQGIKVWLFTHRMCLWAVTEDELDANKKYDAFISYSHKDEEFVNTVLVPGLESEYRICLHYRDWIPGEFIQNQILQSVEDSRRTIVVLSPNFIESVWSQLEFKAAHSQALQDRTNRIIVIVYGQVPENELDEKLRLYISMKTYVKWGDAKFWEKLRYIMPHPRELIQKSQQNGKKNDKLELVKTNSKISV